MRALCDVCEAAPALLFCAADEAALCRPCDEKVHGCNKLASRHVRLELAEARAVPSCDVCEKAPAYFYCEIDGTSLCLQCDMDVHSSAGKKLHERFLLMGQRVEIPMAPGKPEGGDKVPVLQEQRLHQNGNAHPSHRHGKPDEEMREARVADSSGTAMATAIGGEPSGDADTSKQSLLDLNRCPPPRSKGEHSKQAAVSSGGHRNGPAAQAGQSRPPMNDQDRNEVG
ncbi:hypothetical protein KFL_004510030 [Klebsormidium nitens]|uniref:B box-type domain-containing protein n=1 Tax=Klebsormidium nitens TaxID=105231 RepID=A0A1Y1IIZ4_KLENI|nr:hypothetical protein KFL_004510030 [Klebsormidium nitens]|eukprot:GAQ88676.1 hypothetical protein KFL_004510030 [Klebsormidium nitens]